MPYGGVRRAGEGEVGEGEPGEVSAGAVVYWSDEVGGEGEEGGRHGDCKLL